MSKTVVVKDEKPKAIQELLEKVNKTFGQGTMMTLDSKSVVPVEVISTGSLGLDLAVGVGGFPKGRIIEIYGPESSGKTTLAVHVMVEAQKKGGVCAFIDAEHAFDKDYAKAIGLDVDNLLFSQPDNGDQALEIADMVLQSKTVLVLVVDSVAALVPKAELEVEMGDSKMGLHARLMSQAMRKLTGIIKKSNTIVIFINQLRDKIGIMFGNPETTTGGNALKFYASIRIDIRKSTQLKNKEGEVYGSIIKAKVIKNKVAPPFKTAEFEIHFGKGIMRNAEILDMAVELEFVQKSGAWYSYEGQKIGQGKEQVVQLLEDNPEMAKELEEKINTLIKG